MPLQPELKNNIYFRGAVTDSTTAAHAQVTLSAADNELILWPQVINAAKKLGTITLDYDPKDAVAGDKQQVAASLESVSYRPAGEGGRHPTLFVRTEQLSPGENGSDPAPVPSVKNWKDLFSTVGTDDSFAAYNVEIVDPIFTAYSLSTRLRFFDDSGSSTQLQIDVESLAIPEGYEFSLYSEDPAVNITRTALVDGQALGVTVEVKDGYDAPITVQIFNTGGALLPNNASVSIVAHVIEQVDKVAVSYVVGCEHIVFNADARYVKGRNAAGAYDGASGTTVALAEKQPKTLASATAAAAAPAFWFRAALGDSNVFPRPQEQPYISPDIQGSGAFALPNPDQTLGGQNYYVDKSVDTITQGEANNFYLRADCSGPIAMDTRFFAIPAQMLIYPSVYDGYSVQDVDDDGNKVTAIRQFSSTGAGVLVCDSPFNVFNPPSPGAGSHYCLIAEARRTNSNDDWPHEDPPTNGDFANWTLNNPNLCHRNVSWGSYNASTQLAWEVGLTIPAGFFSSTDTFAIILYWKNCPTGGTVSLTTTGDHDFDIKPVTIQQSSLQVLSASYTGLALPYTVTVTIQWNKGSGPNLPAGAIIGAEFVQEVGNFAALSSSAVTPTTNNAVKQPHKTIVGPKYPNLAKGGLVRKSRHKHLNGKSLVGETAFPIPQLPSVGEHENLEPISFRSEIALIYFLGGDQLVNQAA